MPILSIIIPTFNSSRTLSIALDSIIQQSFIDFEILIIDGLSSDNTIEIAQNYNDERIKIFSENDNGIYDAMNKGIALAKGHWLYFLGSDDKLYNENVLLAIYQTIQTTNNKIIYGNVLISGNAGWAADGQIYDGEFKLSKLVEKNICHQAIFYHYSVFKSIGNYNLKYPIWSDWDFNLRCRSKFEFKYIDQNIAIFMGGNLSSKVIDENFLNDRWQNIAVYFKWHFYKKELLPYLHLIKNDKLNKTHSNLILLLIINVQLTYVALRKYLEN